MKRGWQKWLALALAVVMMLSVTPRISFAQEENLLTNGSFESDFWTDHSWSVGVESWDTQETVTAKWSSDAAYEGTHAFHYWSQNAQVMTISQSVTLTAGSYTLSFQNQGASATVQGFIGTMDGQSVTPTGYGTWDAVSDGFTVTADGNYTVGVRLNLSDGGWGDLDDLRLVKQSDEPSVLADGLTVTPAEIAAEAGDTLSFTARWVVNGVAADAVPEGYDLWWWLDSWNDHAGGNSDGVLSNDNGSGKTLTCGLTVPSEGTYYLAAELKQGNTQVAIAYATVTAAPAAVEDNLNVGRIKFQNSDFIRGMDVSSVLALEASGVKFYDENGAEGDLFKILADNGVNYIRVRVWNDPYDSQHNGYGGGNNDVAKAAAIGKRAADNGMKLLVDFHYSDFWADPGKQKAPKAWANMTIDQKAQAVQTFTADALTTIRNAGADIGMVQIGNETTQAICGENTWPNMAAIYNAGAAAVRAFDPGVLVAVHFTNPEKTAAIKGLADKLDQNSVDYDVFATSYYPYWHGSLENLTAVLDYAATTYGKYAMVAETSYAYTLDDSDGFDNTVSRLGNNVGDNLLWPFTPQGQATEVREVMNAVNNVSGGKGLGVFYWEGAWVTVGDTTGLTGDALADKRTATYNGPAGAGVTLPAGTYTFAAKAQGEGGEAVTLSVTDGSTTLATGTATALTGWTAWQDPAVTFTLTEETAVYLRISVAIQPKGWGTVDAMELYGVAAESVSDSQRPTARAGLIYTGQALYLLNAPQTVLPGYTIQYSLDGQTWTEAIATGTDAGDYTVHARYEGNATHPGTLALPDVTATIAKAPAAVEAPTFLFGTPDSVGMSGKAGQVYTIAPAGETPDWSGAIAPDQQGIIHFENLLPATTYTVYAKAPESANHTEATAQTDYTTSLIGIAKEGYDYVGQTITVTPDPEDATGLTYRWYHAHEVEGGTQREDNPISGAESASYTITQNDLGLYLRVEIYKDGAEVGSGEYGPVTYWPADQLTVTLTPAALTGNGHDAVGPGVVVKADDTVLTQGKDYTLSGDVTATAFGTHTITVQGCGLYDGTQTVAWTLSAAESQRTTAEDADGRPVSTDVVAFAGAPAMRISAISPAKALALLGEEDYNWSSEIAFFLQAEAVSYGDLSAKDRLALADYHLNHPRLQIGQYLNLSFFWQQDGGVPTALTVLAQPVSVTVTIPEALRHAPVGFSRSFTLVCIHDGVATALPTHRSGDTLTASTDRFSTYVIAYQDTAAWTPAGDAPVASAATGDHGMLLWSVVLLSSALALPAVIRRRRAG